MYYNTIVNELYELKKTLNKFIADKNCIQSIENAALLISNAFKLGKKVISCGNGGSHCESMHFSEELIGRYRESRKGYPAITISDPSYLSCVGNDFGYDYIFSRYIETIGDSGDVLVAFSTSGKSSNIIKAINTAHDKKMKIVSLIGNNKNEMFYNSDIVIYIPEFKYLDYVQEMHIKIVHILTLLIEEEMKK